MQHLDEGTIHAWLDGALSAEQAADVERHAGECAECAALVADARGMIAGAARIVSALDDVPAGVIPARRAPTTTGSLWRTLRLTPFRAALAASLMVAAASLAVVRSAPQNRVRDMAMPAATPAPSLAVATDTAKLETVAKEKKVSAKAAAAPRVAQAPAPAAAPSPPVSDQQRVAVADSEFRKTAVVAIDSARRRVEAATSQAAAENAVRPTVVGGVAGGAAGMAQARRDVAPRSEPAPALMRSGGLTQALSVVATSADDRPLQVPGCFQLVRDSFGRSFAFPERFSLESAVDSGAPKNIVRAVAQDGRRDSVITGATWRFGSGASRVLLIGSELSSAPVSSFKARTMSSTARGAGAGYLSPARLTRIDCR